MVNIPVGQWDKSKLANIGFNHWAFDINGAVTWLNPTNGLEFSVSPGITFNTKNPDTNYTSGTDLHLEFAAVQHFSDEIGVGLTGYHYQQISDDSGSGAVLGGFRGRVTALGPTANYTAHIGWVPVMMSAKFLREFNVEHRMEGNVGLVSVLFHLGPPPNQSKPN